MSKPVSHYLTVYDGASEQCIDTIRIAPFHLAAFKKQFDVIEDDDPEMLDRYSVSPLDLDFIQPFLSPEFEFDFQNYAYFLEPLRS